MSRAIIVLIVLALMAGPHAARAQAGWKTERVGRNAVLTPPDLAPGEFFQVIVYPRAPLKGAPLADFVDKFADREAAALGKPLGHRSPAQAGENDTAVSTRAFVTAQGQPRVAGYTALGVGSENVRVIATISSMAFSSTDASAAASTLLDRYRAQCQAVFAEMVRQDGAASSQAASPQSPPPHPEQASSALAEAEKRRYKFVTAPGRGLKPAQVEGIYHHILVPMYGTPSADSEAYLLLKDGTVHEDLPVAPDELDVARSRRGEPRQWGRWRRQGKDILFAWPDHPDRFESEAGGMVVGARPGERLSGRYGGANSGGSFAGGGYYGFYGIAFTPDGRFSRDRSGGSSSSGLGSSLNDFSVSTTYNNDESTTTFSAPAAVGGVTSKAKKGGGRAGTYSVNGYTLTLRYDDGHVERLPFYFLGQERDFIYFEGSMLKSGASKL